jgi:hypothetical protein
MLVVCSKEKTNDFFKLKIDSDQKTMLFLEDIALIKIYEKTGILSKFLNVFFTRKYLLVIFLNNCKQVELTFNESKLKDVVSFKKSIESVSE